MSDFIDRLRTEPFVLRNDDTLRYVKRMCRDYPAADFHRSVMEILGCDYSYARKDEQSGVWHAVMELNAPLQLMLGLSSGIHVAFTHYHELQSRTIDAIRSKEIDRPRNNAIYLLHTKDIYAQRKLDDWTFRETYSVLTLNTNGSPQQAAEDLLARIVTASARNNPYDRTTPVSGDEFFGRHETLRGLVTELRSGRVCGVFGLRKTGKTSLLSELGRLFVLGDPQDSVYVLQDLEVLPSSTEQKIPQLISDVANQLKISFGKHGMRTHELAAISAASSVGDLRQAISAALRRGLGPQKSVVLALDEVESLVGSETQTLETQTGVPEFFGALRALVQENNNFNVVISGITTAPIMYPTLYGRENPLFAWAKPTFMAEISRTESDRMIQALGSRMAARWTHDALNRVYTATGGQVFLTRSLSGFVAAKLSNDIASREISGDLVQESFRQWRRTAVSLVDGMIDSLNRFYPDELSVLELGIELPNFSELDDEFSIELSNLINLGVLVDNGTDIVLASWTQLGSKLRTKNR
ncbi:ATP-binding protein [Arthrobacter sp. CC3]|uniref:ATP-binding protein n=1 Tax=Arthrobacter sp. CC3 TaxID=3029185 RepID=UPI003264E261